MSAFIADLIENSYEIDSEYDENIATVAPNSIEIAWRHYRADDPLSIDRYGLPLDRNGSATSNIPLESAEEQLAYDLLRDRFTKFIDCDAVYLRVSTMKGTVFIFKAPAAKEKFFTTTAPDMSPIGEILYFNYIRA